MYIILLRGPRICRRNKMNRFQDTIAPYAKVKTTAMLWYVIWKKLEAIFWRYSLRTADAFDVMRWRGVYQCHPAWQRGNRRMQKSKSSQAQITRRSYRWRQLNDDITSDRSSGLRLIIIKLIRLSNVRSKITMAIPPTGKDFQMVLSMSCMRL